MWTYNFISGTLKEASGFRTESVESRTRQKRPFWVAETQSTHYPSIPRVRCFYSRRELAIPVYLEEVRIFFFFFF